MLVKFDLVYPEGVEHDAFVELAKTTLHSEDVLICHVEVEGGT